MNIVFWITTFIITFCIMEFMAWFTHKYIMHGFLWSYEGFWYGLPIGFGIMAYGASYFIVHDIFIHQRFKLFRKANNWYAKGVRRAHKIHHKNLNKDKSECFGMLIVPLKYFKK